MPVTTRKAKPQARSYIEEAIESSDDEVSTFANVFADPEEDADTDFRKKAKPKSRKKQSGKRQNPGPAPSLPPMSDDEDMRHGKSSELGEYLDFDFENLAEDVFPTAKATRKDRKTRNIAKANPEVPQVIKIQLTGNNGTATTINLNLADIIFRHQRAPHIINEVSSADVTEAQPKFDENDETLVAENAEQSKHRSKRAKMLHDARAQKIKEKSTKKGFTDLPYELRLGIYRRVLVKDTPLDFATQKGFARSGQFLRTCKLVNEEGGAIMYGQNSFHFRRTPATRGAYFEAQWKEIGFKDVRRFLESIGPSNVALMKHVSFDLRDAAPSLTPYLDEEERRCVNDPILHHIFNIIGANAVLEKLYIEFDLRRTVLRTDYFFLKALAGMKCHEFKHALSYYAERRRLSNVMLQNLRKVMVIKKEVDDDVDLSKKKVSSPKMAFTGNGNQRLV